MISKFRVVEKYANLLLLFLIPTQLAIHFWPNFSFLFGIRIDYLSPTIYLTDLLFLTLYIYWLIKRKAKILQWLIGKRKIVLLFGLFIFVNILFSINPLISTIKWAKVLELVLLYFYVKSRKDIFTKDVLSKTIFFSLLTFSIIGLTQFINRGTVGGPLYLLGERSFDVFTPGIAIVNIFGFNLLRIYSTFPHPNSFAGFAAIALIFLACNKPAINKRLLVIGATLIAISLVFTFSLSAGVGLVASLICYVYFRKNKINRKIFNKLFLFTSILSLLLVLFSGDLLNYEKVLSKSSIERLKLANTSGEILKERWLVGTGLNTFIVDLSNKINVGDTNWILQPVHNITLLVFSEAGIIGLVVLYLFYISFVRNASKNMSLCLLCLITFILVTGMFDHYWLTSQQNMLFLAIIFGYFSRE